MISYYYNTLSIALNHQKSKLNGDVVFYIFSFILEDLKKEMNREYILRKLSNNLKNEIELFGIFSPTVSIHLHELPYPYLFENDSIWNRYISKKIIPYVKNLQFSHFCCNDKGVMFNYISEDHDIRKDSLVKQRG